MLIQIFPDTSSCVWKAAPLSSIIDFYHETASYKGPIILPIWPSLKNTRWCYFLFWTVNIFMSFHGVFTNRTLMLTPWFRSCLLLCLCAGNCFRYWKINHTKAVLITRQYRNCFQLTFGDSRTHRALWEHGKEYCKISKFTPTPTPFVVINWPRGHKKEL